MPYVDPKDVMIRGQQYTFVFASKGIPTLTTATPDQVLERLVPLGLAEVQVSNPSLASSSAQVSFKNTRCGAPLVSQPSRSALVSCRDSRAAPARPQWEVDREPQPQSRARTDRGRRDRREGLRAFAPCGNGEHRPGRFAFDP